VRGEGLAGRGGAGGWGCRVWRGGGVEEGGRGGCAVAGGLAPAGVEGGGG